MIAAQRPARTDQVPASLFPAGAATRTLQLTAFSNPGGLQYDNTGHMHWVIERIRERAAADVIKHVDSRICVADHYDPVYAPNLTGGASVTAIGVYLCLYATGEQTNDPINGPFCRSSRRWPARGGRRGPLLPRLAPHLHHYCKPGSICVAHHTHAAMPPGFLLCSITRVASIAPDSHPAANTFFYDNSNLSCLSSANAAGAALTAHKPYFRMEGMCPVCAKPYLGMRRPANCIAYKQAAQQSMAWFAAPTPVARGPLV
mmetsp:Transcript_36630/g.117619  ORF Transcript_36630/g.117619 Transcript_36630/m.117619 type:complete len:259 (-) Transcript_36630:391-1167(-)